MMLPFFSLLLLAFALSLDGFGVGVTYGLRKIKIPLLSVCIISLFSGAVILISMHVGLLLSGFFSPVSAKRVGAVILLMIGIWALQQIFQQKKQETDSSQELSDPTQFQTQQKALLNLELKRFGLVIQILKTPSIADFDRSGNISSSEALLLGLALSLDAFGAGIGAAFIGFAPLLTAVVIMFASGTFITMGLHIGYRFADLRWLRRLSIMPGCLLIVMGLMKLM